MKNEFFGSKLNTVLLIVLVILVVIALSFMFKNKDTYIDPIIGNKTEPSTENKILGNKDDLVSFSIAPGTKVRGVVSYSGVIKGAYFFEANILINVLDANRNILKAGNTMATGDWMTSGPVSFAGTIDFSGLKKGGAFIEIHNDNPSGLPENDKSVLIPVVIE